MRAVTATSRTRRRAQCRRALSRSSVDITSQLARSQAAAVNMNDLVKEGFVADPTVLKISSRKHIQLSRSAFAASHYLGPDGLPGANWTRMHLCESLNGDDAMSASADCRTAFLKHSAHFADTEEFGKELKNIIAATEMTSLPAIVRCILACSKRTPYLLTLSLRRFLHLSNANFAASHVGHTLALLCLQAKREELLPYWSDELSLLQMSCLRYAPWFALRQVFESHCTVPSCHAGVAAKFLSCAAFACHTTNVLDPEGAPSVVSALSAAVSGGNESFNNEETLYHASVALTALGSYKDVFEMYQKFPGMKLSRSQVESHVRQGNLQQALLSLYDLASTKSSWSSLPSTISSACSEVARLVGYRGGASDVHEYLRSLNRFRCPGLKISIFLEEIVLGVCERVGNLPSQSNRGNSVSGRSADERLYAIGVVVDAVMKYSTPSMNRGPIYRLITECMRVQLLEVQLVCSVIGGSAAAAGSTNGFRTMSSELLTGGATSWAQRSAIALARDAGKMRVAEELEQTWKFANSSQHQQQSVSSTVLWRCHNCNLPNSDRFSTCGGCHASRITLSSCGNCTFVQDSSNATCAVCSTSLKISSQGSKVITVVPWNCLSCGEKNDAARLSICGYCKNPRNEQQVPLTAQRCSLCKAPKLLEKQPYCRQCGFKEDHFVNIANHFLWLCLPCEKWNPSLEQHCTTCGITERSAGCCIKPWDQKQTCKQCNHFCTPLATSCSACKTSLQDDMETAVENTPTSAVYCAKCSSITLCGSNRTTAASCGTCGASLSLAERVVVRSRRCTQCRIVVPKSNPSAICPSCSAALPHAEWTRPVIASTLKSLLESRSQLLLVSGLELLLANSSTTISGRGEMPEAVCLIAGIQCKVGPASLLQRRALALCGKLLSLLSPPTASVPVSSSMPCTECLGSHKQDYCPFNAAPWHCTSCSTTNTNEGLGRYFCTGCHTMRPEFANEQVTETWECKSCKRAVVEFESYCIHCGSSKQGDEKILPLAPEICGQCETLHLESSCRGCPKSNHFHEGVVCLVAKRYALIRPTDSAKADDRIFVRENLFMRLKEMLQDKQEVKYTFVVKGGRKLATSVR